MIESQSVLSHQDGLQIAAFDNYFLNVSASKVFYICLDSNLSHLQMEVVGRYAGNMRPSLTVGHTKKTTDDLYILWPIDHKV